MRHSTGKPTKAQEQRFQRLYEMGCVCCLIRMGQWRPATIHHVVEGHRRLGHDATIPLCEWHHQGYPAGGMTTDQTARMLGPSLERQKKRFVAEFGSERSLLEYTDQLLERGA